MSGRVDAFCRGDECEQKDEDQAFCDGCLKSKYMEAISMTEAGGLVRGILDLSALLRQRVNVSMDDFTAREGAGLCILEQERETLARDRKTFEGGQ